MEPTVQQLYCDWYLKKNFKLYLAFWNVHQYVQSTAAVWCYTSTKLTKHVIWETELTSRFRLTRLCGMMKIWFMSRRE